MSNLFVFKRGRIQCSLLSPKVYVYIENNKKYIIKTKRNVYITDQYNKLKYIYTIINLLCYTDYY